MMSLAKVSLKFFLTKNDPFVDRQVTKIPVKQLGLPKVVVVNRIRKESI